MKLFFAAFSGGLTLLRNEASLFFTLSGAELQELGQAFMKGAVVGDTVTEIQPQELFLFAERDVHIEAEVLEVKGALGEPLMLGHAFHQYVLGHGGGLVLFVELGREFDEAVDVFPG